MSEQYPPTTDEERALWKHTHLSDTWHDGDCFTCADDWPCPTVRLLADHDRQAAELDAALATVALLTKERDWLRNELLMPGSGNTMHREAR